MLLLGKGKQIEEDKNDASNESMEEIDVGPVEDEKPPSEIQKEEK